MTTSNGQGSGQGDGGDGKDGPQGAQPENQPSGGATEAPALAVIEAFGGIRPMAKTLGLAVSTVQGWKERAAIPANRHDQIRAAARQNSIDIDPEVLRASAGEGAPAQPQTIEGEVVASKTEAASGGADKPSEKPRASAATAAGAARKSDTPPSAPGRRSAFLPGLMTGVVLAAAVAAATVYTQPYWQPLLNGDAQGGATAAALSEVAQRLTALEGKLPADDTKALSGLSERVATLESALSQGAGQDPDTRAALESLSAQLAGMGDRMTALEQDVASLRKLAGTPSQEVTSRLSDEAQRLDAMVAQQGDLAQRIATAEKDLTAIQSAREGAPGGRETLMVLATLQLRDALQGSGPYAAPLTMLKNLSADDSTLGPIVAPLERHATTGLPTLQELQARFPEVARRIAAIEVGEEGEGWTAGVLRRLAEAVNLRPVGMVEGDAATAVAARAEVKLNDGDLAGALAELDGLKGAAAEAAASWRSDAEARQAADQAVSQLGALVSERFSSMAGG